VEQETVEPETVEPETVMHTVRFFFDEGIEGKLVGSVKVEHGDCIPPYENIEGVATVSELIVSPEEFHGWYYYDDDGKRVDVPDPADVTVLKDMDLYADISPRLPRAIEFVFYGHLGRYITVSVAGGGTESRPLRDDTAPTTPVYHNTSDAVLDGVRRTNITWMFVEERYNAWQIYDLRLGGPPWTAWPSSATQQGLKPSFFTTPSRMWMVYEDRIESGGKFVAERGYNDFIYRPVPITRTDGTIVSANTFYMDHAIANAMEFVKKTVSYSDSNNVEYLVATFHVYPTYLAVDDPRPHSEGGVQGEDEE
jgi:hypothetical protein